MVADLERDFRAGAMVCDRGLVDAYAAADARARGTAGRLEIDSPPLRLMVQAAWVDAARSQRADLKTWDSRPETLRPLLRWHALIEVLGAVGVMWLAWLWHRRARPHAWHGYSSAVAAAAGALFWLNPALILNAHGWPSWEAWLVAAFVWSVLLTSLGCWQAAGWVIGAGAMMHGLAWLAAPVIPLALLLAGRPSAALRYAVGAILAAALCAAPWLLSYPLTAGEWERAAAGAAQIRDATSPVFNAAALIWAVTLVLGTGLAGCGHRYIGRQTWWRLAAGLGPGIAAAAFLPAALTAGWHAVALVAFLGASFSVLTWVLPWRWQPVLWSAAAAGALLSCMVVFGASGSWWREGWGLAAGEVMAAGRASNVPAILSEHFRWRLGDTAFTLPAWSLLAWPWRDWPVTMGELLAVIYAIGLLLSAGAAAIHLRRGDARFLLAVGATWALMFAFLSQMHERFLVVAAAFSACFVAARAGGVLLHLYFTAFALLMSFHALVGSALRARRIGSDSALFITREWAGKARGWLDPTFPSMGWSHALAALALLAMAWALTRPADSAARPRMAHVKIPGHRRHQPPGLKHDARGEGA